MEAYFWINTSMNWRTNVSTSYYFVSTPMSWDDAQKYCRANNTDLVTVENETVNSELLNISDNRSWIGLRHETNHWYWSNGDPVAYTNWIHNFSCAGETCPEAGREEEGKESGTEGRNFECWQYDG
uniref:C-type lectin domain-containing protein n=1 Tax=Erpetoichthys calabaricus TaxID=27687 RepID=A0A8C4T0B3_ERPCA